MAKANKLKTSKGKLNGTQKGKITKTKLKKKNIIKRNRPEVSDNSTNNDDSIVVKKHPSKVELKSVIDDLKKDATLLVARKALKYIPCYLKSEGLTKKLLKEIVRLWAESSEKIRGTEKKQIVIKKLYTTFLEKCRITKHETMSMIGFMRHSLVEIYKLDPLIAFKQAQTSCQQLAITLRNATTHKNEETYKSVLNWQFANCLILLSQLITSHGEDSPVKSLVSQVIQLNLGAINLLISPRYYPYYCHLIENLIHLSISENVFIPILPLIISLIRRIEVPLEKTKNVQTKSNGKEMEKERSMDESLDEREKKKREYNIDLLNHVGLDESRSQEYSVAVLTKLYELSLLYLSSQCHRIAFPELVFLPTVHLKKWLKKNPGNQAHKFRILIDKIKIDCERLEESRKAVDFAFTNYSAVDAWEKKMRDSNKLCIPKLYEKLRKESVTK